MNTGRRIWTLGIVGVTALAFVFVMQSSAVSKAPPKTVVIKTCQKKKPPVTFTHKKHTKIKGVTCKTCHHKKSKVKNCTNCHSKPQKGIGTCKDSSLKKNPFHKQCIGCHKKMKKGPKKCKACHKK